MRRERASVPGLVRRALAGHAAIGLLAGALIYLISLSGTLVVNHDRWERWEQPYAAEMATLSPDAAQAALVAAMAAHGKPLPSQLYLRLPSGELPRATVTIDGSTQLIDARGHLAGRKRSPWTDFVIALHEYLNLPATWGLMAVGAIGVALAAATVTGIVAHPRIFRDAFRLRLRQDPQLARADWHNRLGVWTLPFVLAVALTGAFIGLGNLGFAALAKAYHGGSIEAAYAPLFGGEPPADAAPAPLPDVASALATLGRRVPQATPTYVIVHAPGTRGQFVQILAEHPRRLIYGESYGFDAAGRWRSAAGLADGPLGQQVAASTYNLHFGNYGGLVVELAYMLFGLALCVVTATGITLWLGKRHRRGLPSDRLISCWRIVVWGAPLLIVVAAWIDGTVGDSLPATAMFWGGLASSLILAAVRPGLFADTWIEAVLAMALVATGATHIVRWHAAPLPVATLDVVLIVIPVVVIMITRSISRRVATPVQRH